MISWRTRAFFAIVALMGVTIIAMAGNMLSLSNWIIIPCIVLFAFGFMALTAEVWDIDR